MDNIRQKLPSPLIDSDALTPTTSSGNPGPEPHPVRKSLRKRKNLPSAECFQETPEDKPVKKRKVKLTEQCSTSKKRESFTQELNIREKAKAEAVAKGRTQDYIRELEKKGALREIEQWLNDQGVDTKELKQAKTESDKYTQYEQTLQDHVAEGSALAVLCQGGLHELARIFYDFRLVRNKRKNIENLNKLIAKTKDLKNLITVDMGNHDQLILLKKNVVNRVCKQNRTKREKGYAGALYFKAQSLIDADPSMEVRSGFLKSMQLLGRLAGIAPRPKKVGKTDLNDCNSQKLKHAEEASGRLKTLLEQKYNVVCPEKGYFKIIHVAKKSIQYIRQHGNLPPRIYFNSYFEKFDQRSVNFDGRTVESDVKVKSAREYYQKHKNQINSELLELQKLLGVSLLNNRGNPDLKKTMLTAYNFFDEYEPDSPLPETISKTSEEEAGCSSLMDTDPPIEVGSGIYQSIQLSGQFADIVPRPKGENKIDSSDWSSPKLEHAEDALGRLKTLLEQKYNVVCPQKGHFKIIHVAKESIQHIRQHGNLPPRTYFSSDFEKFDQRSVRFDGRTVDSDVRVKPTKEYTQKYRHQIKKELLELQKLLGVSLLTKKGNPDLEKTMLMAYDFFDEHEPGSLLPESTPITSEEEPGCSSKDISSSDDQQAYAQLAEELKARLNFVPPPENIKELICAAEYCVYSNQWKAPLTKEAYRRFCRSQMEEVSNDGAAHELVNMQLNSLKERLKEVSLQSDKIDKLQGSEIIRVAIDYLNDRLQEGLINRPALLETEVLL